MQRLHGLSNRVTTFGAISRDFLTQQQTESILFFHHFSSSYFLERGEGNNSSSELRSFPRAIRSDDSRKSTASPLFFRACVSRRFATVTRDVSKSQRRARATDNSRNTSATSECDHYSSSHIETFSSMQPLQLDIAIERSCKAHSKKERSVQTRIMQKKDSSFTLSRR